MSFENALDPANIVGAELTAVTAPLLGPPIAIGIGRFCTDLARRAERLFGIGGHPSLPPPPQPGAPPTPDGQGPAHDEIDKINKSLADMEKQLTDLHKASEKAATESGENSEQGRNAHDQILGDGPQLGNGLLAGGTTPEAQAGQLAAMQQQLDELTKNVHDKADAANGIADSLRNLGTGIPGMGMPGLGGGPGLGIPGLGAGGLSPLGGGSPFGGAPTADPIKDSTDLMTPPDVSSVDDPFKPPSVQTPSDPTNTTPPASAATPDAATPPPDTAATPTPPPVKPAPAAQDNDITLPSGQVVTAPNSKAAAAVRNALTHPSGSGDVVTTAYTGTGIDIPTDGADPGRKIDPADVKPGDIIVADDHTAIVAGDGQLIGSDGKLQPLGVINDMSGFKGIFRPTETDPTPTEPTSAQPNPDTTVLAAPAPVPRAPKTPTSPGFGIPAQAHDH